jgi:hypothetical protein
MCGGDEQLLVLGDLIKSVHMVSSDMRLISVAIFVMARLVHLLALVEPRQDDLHLLHLGCGRIGLSAGFFKFSALVHAQCEIAAVVPKQVGSIAVLEGRTLRFDVGPALGQGLALPTLSLVP